MQTDKTIYAEFDERNIEDIALDIKRAIAFKLRQVNAVMLLNRTGHLANDDACAIMVNVNDN